MKERNVQPEGEGGEPFDEDDIVVIVVAAVVVAAVVTDVVVDGCVRKSDVEDVADSESKDRFTVVHDEV